MRAVGQRTTAIVRDYGVTVDVVPSTFRSAGLVQDVKPVGSGSAVEIARSAPGSDVSIHYKEFAEDCLKSSKVTSGASNPATCRPVPGRKTSTSLLNRRHREISRDSYSV